MYYNVCPKCGANLDPGEPCEDCKEKERREEEQKNKAKEMYENMLKVGDSNQLQMNLEVMYEKSSA